MPATREMLEEYGRRHPDKNPLITEALRRGKEPQWIADQLFPKAPVPKPSEQTVSREEEFGTITAPFGSISTQQGMAQDVQSGGMPLTTQPFTDVRPNQMGIGKPQDIVGAGLGAAMVAAGMPQFAPLAAAIPAYLMTLPQGQGKAITEGLIQALSESPSAVLSYINKTQPLLKGFVDEEGAAVLRTFGESGDVPSLELTTGGAWSKWIADVAEGALFAKKMEKYRGKILPAQIERASQNAIKKIFASPVGEIEKGGFVRGAQKIADDLGDEIGKQLYSKVWDEADKLGRTISLESFEKSLGMERFVKASGLPAIEKAMRYRTAASQAGDTVMGNIMSDVASLYEAYGDNVPLKEADELLSRIGKLWKPKMDRTASMAITDAKNHLKGVLKANMSDIPVDLGGGKTTTLWNQYQDARNFWRGFSQEFRNDFVDSAIIQMAQKNPEFVAKKAFGKGNVSDMIRLKKVLSGTPEVFEAVQRAHMQNRISGGILNKMSDIPVGTDPLERLTGMSQEQIKIAFTPQQKTALSDLAKTLHRATQPTGQGKMLVQLTQGGLAVTLLSGGFLTDREGTGVGSAAVVLGGPLILGRMFTNPNTVKLLTQGLRTPRMQAATSMITRIINEYIFASSQEKMQEMIEKNMPEGGFKPTFNLDIEPANVNRTFEEFKP